MNDDTPGNEPNVNDSASNQWQPNPAPQQPAQPYPGNRPQGPAYPGNQQPYPGNRPSYGGGPASAPPPPPPPPPGAYGQPGYGYQPFRPSKPFSGKATASTVIAGAMLIFFPLGIIGNIVGLVFGVMALKDTKEPGGTHRGRGLAMGGVIGNIVVWLMSVVICAAVGFAIFMAVEDAQRNRRNYQVEREQQKKENVDEDLLKVAERLNLYYIENQNSLAPGGPVVNDGGRGGLYPENHPKVQGVLRMDDLVRDFDLNESVYSYKLTVTGETTAEIEHLSTKRVLIVDDVGRQLTHFKVE